MAQIFNDDLAYLNENLDLMTEYAQTHRCQRGSILPLTYRIVAVLNGINGAYVTIASIRYNSTHMVIRFTHNWCDLLAYVEDINNASPVLK